MTHSYVWYDSFICVTWLIHMTWLIYMCDMTHLYVWHDSFICVTWLIYMSMHCQHITTLCNTLHHMGNRIAGHIHSTAPCTWHDSFIFCNMTHLYINTLPTYCNTLWHIAAHCNALQQHENPVPLVMQRLRVSRWHSYKYDMTQMQG